VALDAPRHLVLISREGMQILAQRCGFIVQQTVDDSTRFQFTASELYLKNIPLTEQNPEAVFSQNAIKEFDQRAVKLNSLHRGDAAAFILKAV
jgi:hypothetical protein